MALECHINERAAQPVLTVRARTSVANLSQTLGQAFGAVMQYLAEVGAGPAGAPFTAYYNMDMQDLDISAGFPVSHPLPGKGIVQANEIPAGPQGSVIYAGPYSGIAAAYEALTEYVKAESYMPSGAAYEIYLTDPTQTPPDQAVTEVVFPLVKLAEPVPAM